MIRKVVVENFVMQTSLGSGGYCQLIWPNTATVDDLKGMREICNFQIDNAIKCAERTADVIATEWANNLWFYWKKP